jgi:hypothetical protein
VFVQIQFRGDGPLEGILVVADTKGQVKGKVGHIVSAAVQRGCRHLCMRLCYVPEHMYEWTPERAWTHICKSVPSQGG